MNKLQEACIISHEHWLKEIEKTIESLNIDIPEIKIPEKTKNKVLSIKDSKPKNRKNRSIKSRVIKILIIAAIIASLLMVATAYTPFKSFVVEFFSDYNLFTSNVAKTNHPKKIELKYVPEGYVLVEEDVNSLTVLQKYQCGDKFFIVTKNTPNSKHRISNTYSNEKIFYQNDIKYSLLQLTDKTTEIVWLTDEYAYLLVGNCLENEELIKIAKNIK